MTSLAADAWAPPPVTEACEAVTPTDLVAQVRAARSAADAAELRVLLLGLAWADAHPALPGDESWRVPWRRVIEDGQPDPGDPLTQPGLDEEAVEWFGIPPVRWDAPAAFASANAMSTRSGKALLRDALVLRHRLPRTWRVVRRGGVPVWRARLVAQAVLGQPADVVAYVDERIAPVVARASVNRLARLVDEAMLRLHAEEREIAQLEALDRCGVELDETTIGETGIAELVARGEWADLSDFEAAVTAVAEALAGSDDHTAHLPLGVRRARAVGILADPEAAQALLASHAARPAARLDARRSPAPGPARRTVRRTVRLVVHLSEAALLGLDPLVRDEAGRPLLDQVVREWCGRTDTRVVVQPVIDLAEPVATEQYAVSPLLAELVAVRDVTCVFPWCSRAARACDHDHVDPHRPADAHGPDADGPCREGATCSCNIAALCRHHHNLKTHAGWSYTPLGAGTYLWRDRHGQRFLRDPVGTSDLGRDGSLCPPRQGSGPARPDG